jgi:hypothetical protein
MITAPFAGGAERGMIRYRTPRKTSSIAGVHPNSDAEFGGSGFNGYDWGGRSMSDDRCNSDIDNPGVANQIEEDRT